MINIGDDSVMTQTTSVAFAGVCHSFGLEVGEQARRRIGGAVHEATRRSMSTGMAWRGGAIGTTGGRVVVSQVVAHMAMLEWRRDPLHALPPRYSMPIRSGLAVGL